LSAGAGLFAAVAVAYLLMWYNGVGAARAQTIAFVTWVLGHVFLALNLRSEREALIQLGLLANRLMIDWAAATVVFVLIATLVPAAQVALKPASLSSQAWGRAVGALLVG